MSFDALAALREAGNLVDLLSSRQQAVLAELTEAEISVLNSIKRRLDDANDSEVEGHSDIKIV